MRRTPIVAGNWKMNGTLEEGGRITREILRGAVDFPGAETVLCPPYTALAKIGEMLKGSRIDLGAQNLHWEPKGAYTGEISAGMLQETGCRWCIVGHSERRHLLGETDEMVRKKAQAGWKEGYLRRALKRRMILRMRAVRATLGALPLAVRRW